MSPEVFNNTEKLYHYTSLTTGTLILLSQTLRMSQQSKMNDINESYRTLYSEDCDIENVVAEMKKYFQSSFTLDNELTPGFAIPAMWGHYADKGRGICLVFDKIKLLSAFNKYNTHHGIIRYSNKYDSSIIVKDDPKQYITENIIDIFFRKSNDWAYEQEYRFILRAENEPVIINISKCIIAVIAHQFADIPRNETQFNSPSYKILENQTKELGIPVLLLSLSPLNGKLELTDHNLTCWYSKK